MELKIINVTENGFKVDGSGKVSIPACKIKAVSYSHAIKKLNWFLETKELDPDIELITPFERIAFE